MCCTIWYHLYNFENTKNIRVTEVLLLVKLQASVSNITKSNTPLWVFFTFFKLHKRNQIAQRITHQIMLGLTFYCCLDWGSYIIFIAKTASKKIGALIHSLKLLSPEVALYLYKYSIYSLAWNTVVTPGLLVLGAT